MYKTINHNLTKLDIRWCQNAVLMKKDYWSKHKHDEGDWADDFLEAYTILYQKLYDLTKTYY